MKPQKIKIMVATHKAYEFPADPGYIPLHVGKIFSGSDFGVLGDDRGDNISNLNKSFCELTGLYWFWKNVDAEYIGLAHYRRYFKPINSLSVKVKNIPIATSEDLLKLLETRDVLVSRKRCYYVDTIYSHYKHSHYFSDLLKLKEILYKECPEYIGAFENVFEGRCLSLYNMFVMKKDFFDEYSDWLFKLLFQLEKEIDYQSYGVYQQRVFGFLSERLLNVWLEHNISRLQVLYLPVVNIEGENLFKKALGLLKRKFLGKKAK